MTSILSFGRTLRYGAIPELPFRAKSICLLLACLAAVLALARGADAQQSRNLVASLKTSDARIVVSAGSHAPQLISLTGTDGAAWHNQMSETLPATVEMNGASIVVSWHLMPKLGIADPHQVLFVYESVEPHLRLQWQWQARAGFGPLEHRITIENLSGQQIWLHKRPGGL